MKKIITCLTLFLVTTGICLAKNPNKVKQNKLKSKVDVTINTNSCGYITSMCTSSVCHTVQPPPSNTCESPYPPTGPESVPTDGPGRG